MDITYYPSAHDAGASPVTINHFSLSNHVRNELNGERASPDAVTTPADGSPSQFFYPRQFPLGVANIGKSRAPSDPDMGPVYIPTDAKQEVPVYGVYAPGTSPQPLAPIGPAAPAQAPMGPPPPVAGAGIFVPTGSQMDTGYGFHEAVKPDKPFSWGCGMTKGANAESDIKAMAKLSDAAINSGGKATVKVEE